MERKKSNRNKGGKMYEKVSKFYNITNLCYIKKDGTPPTTNDYIEEIEVKSETPLTITLKFPNGDEMKLKKRVAFSLYYTSYEKAVQATKEMMLRLKSSFEKDIERIKKLIAIWETVLKEYEQ